MIYVSYLTLKQICVDGTVDLKVILHGSLPTKHFHSLFIIILSYFLVSYIWLLSSALYNDRLDGVWKTRIVYDQSVSSNTRSSFNNLSLTTSCHYLARRVFVLRKTFIIASKVKTALKNTQGNPDENKQSLDFLRPLAKVSRSKF